MSKQLEIEEYLYLQFAQYKLLSSNLIFLFFLLSTIILLSNT